MSAARPRPARPRTFAAATDAVLTAALLAAAFVACGPRGAEKAAGDPGPGAGDEQVWFRGDFESGDLRGWYGDLPRPESAQVVEQPVRSGRYAVRVTLAPGDRAAHKEGTELRLEDRDLERARAGEGRTVWYGLSLLIPEDHEDPPGGQYPTLAQWHHRPAHSGRRDGPAHVAGPPPLTLFLVSGEDGQTLVLIGQETRESEAIRLAWRPIERGGWIDLVIQVRWSTGADGFVAAWLDGKPFTDGKRLGPTLYNPLGNYLRLGYYRGKGGTTTNHVYYDDVWMADAPPAPLP